MTTLLIDGDSFAYAASCVNEMYIEWPNGTKTHEADADEAIGSFELLIEHLVERYDADDYRIALTGTENFRKKVYPGYKAKRGKKPIALKAVKEHAVLRMGATLREPLEADDVIGIWATHPTLIRGPKLVVSIDKDLRTIPCSLSKGDGMIFKITPREAFYYFMTQTITGDTTDNYPGIPGVGPKGAEKILDPHKNDKAAHMWAAVVAAYEKKGLTADDALVQARVARILRAKDYDFQKKEPILWNPPETP